MKSFCDLNELNPVIFLDKFSIYIQVVKNTYTLFGSKELFFVYLLYLFLYFMT